MIFTSFEFVLFFAFVLLVRQLIPSLRAEKMFLLLGSFGYYLSWSAPYCLLLLSISFVAYLSGIALSCERTVFHRRIVLITTIVITVGSLAFFKYTNFLLAQVEHFAAYLGFPTYFPRYDIALPVGVSFFTFIALTYSIDVYRRRISPSISACDVMLSVSFFPQILAGPINRVSSLLPQFDHSRRASAIDFETGLAQFGLGAVKKLVLSDRIAPHVDMIFSAPGQYDALTLFQGLLGYTIQIYCDFSGYSDMAIGCARMMGFRFMENFRMPYAALSITEFWRRWHISLSTWFRDYLYIPLGGSRAGNARTYTNLMITMLLCGLWHGPSWNFVFWGALHGGALAIHRAWRGAAYNTILEGGVFLPFLFRIASRALTLTIVVLGWLFFRADSWNAAWQHLHRILIWTEDGHRMISPYILAAVAVVSLAHFLVPKDALLVQNIAYSSFPVRLVCYSCLTVCIVCLATTDVASFIYFQF